jgi:hypothetical protein
MDQTTSVLSSARQAKRTPAKPTLRNSVEKHGPKRVRKNGMVVSTILFDPQMDEQLSALAFAWNTDRSELARRLINSGLSHYDVVDEVRKAAERFRRAASVESDETADRQDDGADVSLENSAA